MGQYELLGLVVRVFESIKIPYIVTGSMASMAYGEPRLTNDIDIVAKIEETHIPLLIAAFPRDKFYLDEDAIREAICRLTQFNIIHPSSGLKIDIIIYKDTLFDRNRFERTRRIFPAETYQANFASPEDVIIKKMEYYREGGSEKHLRDITGVLKVSGNEVDLDYITKWSKELGLTEIWEAIQRRLIE